MKENIWCMDYMFRVQWGNDISVIFIAQKYFVRRIWINCHARTHAIPQWSDQHIYVGTGDRKNYERNVRKEKWKEFLQISRFHSYRARKLHFSLVIKSFELITTKSLFMLFIVTMAWPKRQCACDFVAHWVSMHHVRTSTAINIFIYFSPHINTVFTNWKKKKQKYIFHWNYSKWIRCNETMCSLAKPREMAERSRKNVSVAATVTRKLHMKNRWLALPRQTP